MQIFFHVHYLIFVGMLSRNFRWFYAELSELWCLLDRDFITESKLHLPYIMQTAVIFKSRTTQMCAFIVEKQFDKVSSNGSKIMTCVGVAKLFAKSNKCSQVPGFSLMMCA